MPFMLRLNAWIGGLTGWRRRGFAVLLGASSAAGNETHAIALGYG